MNGFFCFYIWDRIGKRDAQFRTDRQLFNEKTVEACELICETCATFALIILVRFKLDYGSFFMGRLQSHP